MQEHFGALARRRFDARIRVRSIKAMDALRNIVHGHAGAAALRGTGIGAGGSLIKQPSGGALVHAHAVVGHGNQDCVVAVLMDGHIDPQGIAIAHAMPHGVLDNGLDYKGRDQRVLDILGDIEGRQYAVLTKARLLKRQVALWATSRETGISDPELSSVAR